YGAFVSSRSSPAATSCARSRAPGSGAGRRIRGARAPSDSPTSATGEPPRSAVGRALATEGPPGRAAASAWRRVVPSQAVAPLSGGAMTPCRPCLAASSRRRSGCPTQRSSPVSPSSPKHALGVPLSGTPRLALATASATARSQPGSSTRTPPTTFTNTSELPVRILPWRPRMASTKARRLRSRPETTLRGCSRSQRLHLDEQRPGALHRSQHHAPGGACGLGHEARRGVQHLDQPALSHLEQARLVGGAEAVLERAQLAIGTLALALELQHAVNQMLEHARPR